MPAIYVIGNRVNSKAYIGIVKNGDIHRRFKTHIRNALVKKEKAILYRAMRKYGVENFYVYRLREFEDWRECNLEEIRLIRKFSLAPAGYNAKADLQGGPTEGTWKWSQKAKEKLKKTLSQRKNSRSKESIEKARKKRLSQNERLGSVLTPGRKPGSKNSEVLQLVRRKIKGRGEVFVSEIVAALEYEHSDVRVRYRPFYPKPSTFWCFVIRHLLRTGEIKLVEEISNFSTPVLMSSSVLEIGITMEEGPSMKIWDTVSEKPEWRFEELCETLKRRYPKTPDSYTASIDAFWRGWIRGAIQSGFLIMKNPKE